MTAAVPVPVAPAGVVVPDGAPVAVVVVGASAGGVEALRVLVAGLPAGLAAPVVAVLHIPRHAPSALAPILDRAGPLPARTAGHRAPLQPGVVHVAPADRNVLLARDELVLAAEPVGNHLPGIDELFRSAAEVFGPGAVAVVLSGTGNDGAAGAAAVAAGGGRVLVQDPADAEHGSMPSCALELVPSARRLPVAELGAAVAALVAAGRRPAP